MSQLGRLAPIQSFILMAGSSRRTQVSSKRTTGTSHQVNFLSNVLLKSCAQRRRFTPEQTANLQTALMHLDGVRAQIPTAQQGSIRSKSSPRWARRSAFRVHLLPV